MPAALSCAKCEHGRRTGGRGWRAPFFFVCGDGHVNANTTIAERLEMVGHFDEATLRRALRDTTGLQQVVRLAIERRLAFLKELRK